MKAETLLSALSADDYTRVRDAVETASASLRAREFEDGDAESLAEKLIALSEHPKWEVRRAIASAIRFLRHEAIEPTLTRLAADDNAQVARAAQKARAQRRERASVQLLPEALDQSMQELLADLETRHNAKTREAAFRVGVAYTEFMVRALCHQVGNALMPLDMTVATLEELTPPGPALERVKQAKEQMRMVSRVLSNANQFVRTTPPNYRPTPIRAVVERALDDVRLLPVAQANGLEACVDIDAAWTVEAIESRVYEAVHNVIKNAVEASEERRPIPLHVAATKRKGQLTLTIRDEGCGMPEQQYKRDIWRPYGSQKRTGTGLGVPLVKKIIVLEHHGVVNIESTVGVGTTVTLILPIEQEF